MGYRVHSVDGKQGEVSLAHLATRTAQLTLASPAASSHVICRVPAAATVTAVRAYLVDGTSVTVNAVRRRSTTNVDLLSSNLLANSAGVWTSDTTNLQNTALAAGDTLIAKVTAAAGSPTEAVIEVDYTISTPA